MGFHLTWRASNFKIIINFAISSHKGHHQSEIRTYLKFLIFAPKWPLFGIGFIKGPINGQNGSQNRPNMLDSIRNNDFYHIYSEKKLHITNM